MEVGNPHDMLAQIEFLRANALGRFDSCCAHRE